jgi:RND family efflux transporter MFP subunit
MRVLTPPAARRLLPFVVGLSVTAACGGNSPAAGGAAGPGGPGGPGGMPAMGVEVITLEQKPVERTTEFVGTVKSRRSTTINPQVEGLITRIAVRSGDRVTPGRVLMEIDAEQQQASVGALESQRAAREAELAFARQQAERLRTLLEAGAASQQEFDQASTALKAAEAQVRAIDQQITLQRVELGRYRVTAPTAGIVGDVPVRVGDRVTRSTLLTTVDDNAGLEIYVSVPVQQAPGLKLGLPIRVLDEQGGELATYPVTFVAPTVDDATQTVLVKAQVREAGRFRADQFVRALLVWTAEPGLTVPVVAVNRINGQHFAYVAEPGKDGGFVARQRAVETGALVGNDYVVRGGLEPGQRLIVSGVQKIGDGMPVRIGAAGPPAQRPGQPGPAAQQGQS